MCALPICSVAQSCLTLCNPMDCSTPGFPVHHQLPELTQIHVHWVSDAIQPSHPLALIKYNVRWNHMKLLITGHFGSTKTLISGGSTYSFVSLLSLRVWWMNQAVLCQAIVQPEEKGKSSKIILTKMAEWHHWLDGCESWTIKKPECQGTDALEL